ncbi:MAG: hypothetical protein BWX87_02821 [Bacteroidetes bacterium ADurb.Bin123]|nr:MAG: hypothetical protein BWX87_02821 [Bacteroidetes bacterium ADurb.Bin123]
MVLGITMKIKRTISLDQEVHDQVQVLADKQGIGFSTLINAILKGGLDSTQELVSALSGVTIPRLLEILTEEGKKKKKKK